ncbi:separin [Trichonephila clavipes]|nr:separin [Trichonephila clavipes]
MTNAVIRCHHSVQCKVAMPRYCSEEEVISVVTKLLNFPSTKYHQACVILEVLTMSPSISEKISEIVNKGPHPANFSGYLENPTNPNKNKPSPIKNSWEECMKTYMAKSAILSQVIPKKETEVFLKSGFDDEENETCDIKPAFPLLTYLVEAEIINSLELALEVWTDISENTDNNWSSLAEIIRDWDLLTIIQATAEFFSNSAYVCSFRSFFFSFAS